MDLYASSMSRWAHKLLLKEGKQRRENVIFSRFFPIPLLYPGLRKTRMILKVDSFRIFVS